MGGREDEEKRNRVRMFIHAAEGTFMVHFLAITYARWFSPESVHQSADLKILEEGLAINLCEDLDWLDSELYGRRFLAGEMVTAADMMCLFSVQFIFERGLCGGRKMGEWKNIEGWIKACEGTESWKRAVEKTGHKM
jgi:glutathione S-transferase